MIGKFIENWPVDGLLAPLNGDEAVDDVAQESQLNAGDGGDHGDDAVGSM